MRADPDWEEYHRTWSEAYQNLNYNRSLSAFCMRKSHALIEEAFGPDAHFSKVLEVGAGGGQHFPFVRHRFDEYVLSDSSNEMLEIASSSIQNRLGLRFERQSAVALSVADKSFDRLIATHVLEHLERPHEVLREWHRVLKPGGVMS